MVRNMPFWGRRAAVLVALLISGSAVGAALMAADVSRDQERSLLAERAGELSSVLSLSIADARSVLLVSGTVPPSEEGDETFTSVTARAVLGGATVGVVSKEGPGYTVLRGAGPGAPNAGARLDPAIAGVVTRAADAQDLVAGVVETGGAKHVVLALAGREGRVAYQDSVVQPAQSVPRDPDSPFRELDVAIYAGAQVDPDQLILVSGRTPGSDGPVVNHQFKVGVDTWSMAISAREPLVGTLAGAFPWLLGVGGLITAVVVGLLIDAQRRRREYALELVREAQQAADEANRARETFFASVSHDIRAPLTAIMGFTEMISVAEPEQQDEFVQRVRSNVATLGVMVDNMLDHARVQAGALEVVVEPLCLREHVERCLEDLGPVLSSHKIAVRGDSVTVLADQHALRRILANILINAVRYSPPGTPIEIELSAHSAWGRIAVADRGRGIEKADLSSIFDMFSRGSRAQSDGGTGLGLFSVHQLVGAQSGSVDIDSRPGEGTTVTVELPRAA